MSTEPDSTSVARTVSLHPYSPVDKDLVQSLEVHIERKPQQVLSLRYVLRGNLDRLRLPTPKPPQHTDELWKHTCFEAFIKARQGAAYHELNASPSMEWALYSFDDYRKGMQPAKLPQPPAINLRQDPNRLTVEVLLDLKVLPPSRALALAAVLEDESGSLSYWAVSHPGEKPDFHHPDGFVLEI